MTGLAFEKWVHDEAPVQVVVKSTLASVCDGFVMGFRMGFKRRFEKSAGGRLRIATV